VIINPEDAAKRGLLRDKSWRFSTTEERSASAKVSDITRPGIVVAPPGYWCKLSHAGNTINAATAATFTDMGHAAAVGDALVEVVLVS
jgi:anaerobic selenocysteine-containing dehydrogenase